MPRFTIDVDDKFNQTLAELAQGTTTKADVLRRALASYHYLKTELATAPEGRRVCIADSNGTITQDVVLP